MSNRKQSRISLGLDLGGTQIKAAVVEVSGKVHDQLQIATPAERQVFEVVQALVKIARQTRAAWPQVSAIGVGAAGLVDSERKVIRVSPNFPAWNDVPLGEILESEIQLPLFLENDVNCMALAEQRWGAGKSFNSMLTLAVGTGIGGAIILDGRLYRGVSGAAGELGHISVDLWGPKCACGNLGCVERYLGGRWFVQAAQETLGDETIKSPLEVSMMARKGNQRAVEFIENRGEILGVACVSLINIFDPEAIIIGGGIAAAGEPLFRGVRRAIKERAYPHLAQRVKILPAALGGIAGAMGAALLGLNARVNDGKN